MIQGIEKQIIYLLAVFICGAVSGLFYDALRAKRRLSKPSDTLVNIEDIFFLLLCGIIILAATYRFNSGEIRAGTVIGAASGFFVYYFVFKNSIMLLLVKLFKILIRLAVFILRLLFFPLKLTNRLLKKPVCVIVWYAGGKYKKVKSILGINLHKMKKRIYINRLFTKRKKR